MGYFDSEFSYYEYEFIEVMDAHEVVVATVATEETSVVHLIVDAKGDVVSEVIMDSVTCEADIARTHPDALELAMRYLETGGKER